MRFKCIRGSVLRTKFFDKLVQDDKYQLLTKYGWIPRDTMFITNGVFIAIYVYSLRDVFKSYEIAIEITR